MKTLLKKSLLVLMIAFIAIFTLGISSKVKAAEVVESVDFTTKAVKSSNYKNTWTYDGWTVSGGANNNGGWAYVKMGGHATNLSAYNTIYIASPKVASATSKVEVNIIAGSLPKSGMSATVQLEVYSDSSLATKVDSTAAVTVTKSAALLEFEPTNGVSWPANSYYKVVFNCTNTSSTNGIVWLDNVSIYDYNAGDALAPSIKLDGDNYTEVDDVVTLTATTANLTSSLVWSSSDSNIATVDQSGNVTAKSMGVATITAAADGAEATFEFTVYPTDGSEITIAQALTICDWVGTAECAFTYAVTGVVETINTEYNSSYNNITVTITDGANSIQAYRMTGGSDLVVGDKITIEGTLTKYSGNTPQFTAGATYVAVADEGVVAAAKEALNAINAYMSLAYKYTRDQQEVAATADSILMKHSEASTSNLTAEENSAAIFGLDANLFSVISAKNKASNEVGINKDGTFRLYANAASQKGTSLTISTLNGQKITSIEVEFGATVGSVAVNGETVLAGANESYTYQVDSESATILNVTSTNVQVWIKSITINLASSTEVSYVDVFTETEFRIKCGVDLALADIEGVDSYGIKVFTDNDEKELTAAYDDEQCLYTIISLGDALTNKARLDVVFTVQAFIVIDGVTYVSELTKSFSVREMVETYYNDPATQEKVASLYALIENL